MLNSIEIRLLEEYGFKQCDKGYIYKRKLDSNYYVVISYVDNNFVSKVYDNYDYEYILFNVKEATGVVVSELRNKVNNIIEDIINRCTSNKNNLNKILEYVKKKYNTLPDYPFCDDDTSMVLRNSNNKWYAIMVEVPYKYFGMEIDKKVYCINLKNSPDKVKAIVDNKNIYLAYHMNKKHWFTIIIDSIKNIDDVYLLIDESYRCTCKKGY